MRRTPVLHVESGTLGTSAVTLKLDLLQPTGSFKVRGAMSLLTGVDVPDTGVVAASGGNFGLAVCWAAARIGVPAAIFVPATSPRAKLDALARTGAQVEVVDGRYAEALEASRAHVGRTGALFAHAYDQFEVVAGQGTLALEVEQDTSVDTILVACGGGGLVAGIAAAVGDRVRVIAVETTDTPTYARAIEAGRPVDVAVAGIAASSLGARRVGDLVWALREGIASNLLVDDADVEAAIRQLWDRVRLVAEPGGAAAVAALTSGAYQPEPGERVVAVVCGANTDPASVLRDPAASR